MKYRLLHSRKDAIYRKKEDTLHSLYRQIGYQEKISNNIIVGLARQFIPITFNQNNESSR